MKVIFLDIDGVLNSDAMLKRKPYPNCHGLTGIDKYAVKKLKAIVEATDAKIVLTSSWKKSFDIFKRNNYKVIYSYIIEHGFYYVEELEFAGVFGKYLSNKLYEEKLKVFDTTSKAEYGNSDKRGTGILNYIKENQVDNYVILDDEIFADYREKPEILNHLVLTDFLVGLTDEDVNKAIKILKGE